MYQDTDNNNIEIKPNHTETFRYLGIAKKFAPELSGLDLLVFTALSMGAGLHEKNNKNIR